jgi:hypothetical protein
MKLHRLVQDAIDHDRLVGVDAVDQKSGRTTSDRTGSLGGGARALPLTARSSA